MCRLRVLSTDIHRMEETHVHWPYCVYQSCTGALYSVPHSDCRTHPLRSYKHQTARSIRTGVAHRAMCCYCWFQAHVSSWQEKCHSNTAEEAVRLACSRIVSLQSGTCICTLVVPVVLSCRRSFMTTNDTTCCLNPTWLKHLLAWMVWLHEPPANLVVIKQPQHSSLTV